MWELDHKEGWAPKYWCFWTLVLKKTFESTLDCKAIKPVNPKGNQPWIFTGRTDAETEAPILWSPDAKSRLTGKDSDTGKDWGQADKGMTEDGIIHSVDWVFLCGCCTCCYLAIIWGICCCLYVSNLYFVNLFTPEVCMCLLSHVQLFASPSTVTHQAPLSMRFPKQEYRSGLSFHSLENLPHQGLNPGLLFWSWVLGCWATREACRLHLLAL